MTHHITTRFPSLLTVGITGLCLVGGLMLSGCWTEPVDPPAPVVDDPGNDDGSDEADEGGTVDLSKSGLSGSSASSSGEGNAAGGHAGDGSEHGGAAGADHGGDRSSGGSSMGGDHSSKAGDHSSMGGNRSSSGSSTAGNRSSSGSSTAGNRSSGGSSTADNRSSGGSSGGSAKAGNRSSSGSTAASNRSSSGSTTASNRSSSGSTTASNRSSSGSTTASNRSSGGSSTAGNRSSSGSSTSGNRSSSGSSTAGNRSSSGSATKTANRSSGGASGSASGNRSSGSKDPGGQAKTDRTRVNIKAPVETGDATDVADVDAAQGVTEYSGEQWQELREARFILDMGEPGPGTNPKCYAEDMAPLAVKGRLTKDSIACIQKALSEAERSSDQAQLSLVLITNANARDEVENWEWLVARHLEIIDEENPGLSYRYAMHLYSKGEEKYPEALRWANVALAQRAAWAGDAIYHARVTRLYKVRAALAQSLWRKSEAEWARQGMDQKSDDTRDDVLDFRDRTRKMALEWYNYAEETGMDLTVPYQLCVNASIGDGCEGVPVPPS